MEKYYKISESDLLESYDCTQCGKNVNIKKG